MGIGGTLEFLSDLLGCSGHKHKRRKQLQTVELKVRMDCEGCELKIKNTLSSMKGLLHNTHMHVYVTQLIVRQQ